MTHTMEASTSAYEPESALAFLQYKRDTEHFPLLTAEQERDLAIRIQAGLTKSTKQERPPFGRVSYRQIIHLTPDAQDAFDALCYANVRLVEGIAKKFMGHGLSLMDLIEEGNIGMMRAARSYNADRARFSTHATYWIRQAIGRAVMERSRAIHLPTHTATAINRVCRIATLLTTSLGREPTVEEIAQEARMTVTAVSNALRDKATVQPPMSLDEPLDAFSDAPIYLCDVLEDSRVPMEEQTAATIANRDVIERALANRSLTARERLVIRLRFGLDGTGSRSLNDIGRDLGVVRERVRQIEARALQKLRQAMWMEEEVSA